MKKILLVAGYLSLVLIIVGCASLKQITRLVPLKSSTAPAVFLSSYYGLRVRIAVTDFEMKAAKATSEIGLGLREMLVNVLINSNRFSVVEYQTLSAVIQKQELSASGAALAGSGPQKDKIKTADLVIAAAVTEFEPQTSGGKAGIGGGGGVGSGILGGLLGTALNKARMALDIRIVDTSASGILATTRVQGQASDMGGAFMAGFLGGWGLDAGLSAYANTPMEKAIRICIIEAVRYISEVIPASYYKY